MNKLTKLSFLLFLIAGLSSSLAQAQTNSDNELWTSVELGYKVNKKLNFEFREMLRLKEDYSEIDQYYSQLSTEYRFAKSLSFTAGYRFIRKNDNKGKIQGYENLGRLQFDLKYRQNFDRFKMRYRFRYQNKQNYTKTDEYQNAVRFKATSAYNIRNWKLDPKLAYEYFIPTNTGDNRYRVTLSTVYKLKNAGALHFAYSYEREVGSLIPDVVNSLRLKYHFDLK
ncbi:MAG: DUF2490 domain-containing protein [Flavobacteriaceae bacterium]